MEERPDSDLRKQASPPPEVIVFGSGACAQKIAANLYDHGVNAWLTAKDLKGAWMLFDNEDDPYQLNNLVDFPEAAGLMRTLDAKLAAKLKEVGDEFKPGLTYVEKWAYPLDETETVPYAH